MFTFHWWQQLCLLIQPRDIKTQRRHSWVDTTSPLFFPAKFTYLECFPKGQTTNGLHSAPMHASVQIWIGKVCYQYSNVATIPSTFSRNEIKVKGFSLLTHISTSKQLKHHKHTTARTLYDWYWQIGVKGKVITMRKWAVWIFMKFHTTLTFTEGLHRENESLYQVVDIFPHLSIKYYNNGKHK